MTCDRYIELISAGIDGELTESEATELHIHLSGCSTCREISERLQAQRDLLLESYSPDQPDKMRDKIKQRIGIKEPESKHVVWHVGHIPERIIRSHRTTDALPTPGPILGPMGRA